MITLKVKDLSKNFGSTEELKTSNNKGVIWANQFDNIANAKAHYKKH